VSGSSPARMATGAALQPPRQRPHVPVSADRQDTRRSALELVHHRRRGGRLRNDASVFLYAFDLIELNGDDLRRTLMKKKLIFDIGAHKGEDTRFYLRKGFRVVAVEAYPHHVQHIQDQLADDILRGDLVVEQVGIGETRGRGKFYVHETHTDWHRSEINAGRA